jgi:uncharacterized protein (TIGR02117 family)
MVMVRWLQRIAIGIICAFVALLCLAHVLRQSADTSLYPPTGRAVGVVIVDHGYHAGLILPIAQLTEIARADGLTRLSAALAVFDQFDHVEIGWGEENFYRYVPQASITSLHHVVRALLNPANRSVLHVVGLSGDPARAFRGSDSLTLAIDAKGLQRIAAALDAEFRLLPTGDVAPLGPGLYGPSAFYGAVSRYHLLNTCNHWAGRMLSLAGLPYSPVEATLSVGLMADLRRRASHP